MILADENIFDSIIIALRNEGYDVYSIKESNRGFTDISIAEFSLKPPRIILTEDKDFGAITFASTQQLTGVIMLRYAGQDRVEITKILIDFLKKENLQSLTNMFVTISIDKIRIKAIFTE